MTSTSHFTTSDIQDLVQQLQPARDAYYGGDPPIMTDAEYDALEDELREIDPSNPFFKAVGAKVKISGWKKVRHGAPMGSLLKVQTPVEMEKWLADTASKLDGATSCARMLTITEKLDGISISLQYQAGKLIRALTRGDGETGEDITRNVLLMKGVQATMRDFTGFVRGEIVLCKTDHKKHLSEYKNPRNAASGIAKRESDPDPCKHLTVVAYQVITDKHNITQKSVELKLLEALGCKVPRWQTVSDEKGVLAVYDVYLQKTRAELDYEIDGLVVEYDALDAMEHLGEHDGRPKGARAFKFPHDSQRTNLRSIVWQVGSSGRITPVAYFDAVDLAGATVAQASLHNETNIRRLAEKCPQGLLGMGDTILVSRRNDVIPYFEQVIHPSANARFSMPTDCPSCNQRLVKRGEFLICENSRRCPAQVSGAIKRWVAKLDVKDWGETLIDALCAEGTVSTVADLYKLTVADLENFQLGGKRLGTSSAIRVLDNLHAKKELRLADFIGALGIDLCGQTVCQIIVDAGYDTIEKMEDAAVSQLAAIPMLGETKATAFVEGFRRCRKVIDGLLGAGVHIKSVTTGKLTGKSFCFTGVRDRALEDRLKDAGATIKGSVGRGLTYLIARDPKSTSGKAAKAKEYGVIVIGVDDAEALL